MNSLFVQLWQVSCWFLYLFPIKTCFYSFFFLWNKHYFIIIITTTHSDYLSINFDTVLQMHYSYVCEMIKKILMKNCMTVTGCDAKSRSFSSSVFPLSRIHTFVDDLCQNYIYTCDEMCRNMCKMQFFWIKMQFNNYAPVHAPRRLCVCISIDYRSTMTRKFSMH